MFPIPWNKAVRKKDGNLVTLEEFAGGGGGGSELPEYSEADAGKVLGVDENGDLAWVTVSGSSFRRGISKVSGNVIVSGKEVSNAN